MKKCTSVALGFFDGVHMAHQKIIMAAVNAAEEKGLRPVALSFDAPPALALFGSCPPLLTDNDEKCRLIASLGSECLLLPTTKELLSMTGEEFIRSVLIEQLKADYAVCGFNYHFGRDRQNAGDLTLLGEKYGIEIMVLPEERLDGEVVSSSRIRELLSQGRMEQSAMLLGRPYSLIGTVAEGKHLGRTMGFPTINIYPDIQPLIPRGVYAAKVIFDNQECVGVTNVGVNPTVNDNGMRVETHIPHFDGNLYGKTVEIQLFSFIRPERKFTSVEELFAQIKKDTVRVQEHFSTK